MTSDSDTSPLWAPYHRWYRWVMYVYHSRGRTRTEFASALFRVGINHSRDVAGQQRLFHLGQCACVVRVEEAPRSASANLLLPKPRAEEELRMHSPRGSN